MKRGLILIVFLIAFFGIVSSQTDVLSEIESAYPDAEIETKAGIGPDNFFYFFDRFFDRFGDDLKVKEERIAEIREMIQQGKYEEARIALERYKDLADKLEAEISPENREEARRGAAAIRKAILEIESDIPEEFRAEFVDSILEKEERIVMSAEIALKIKGLCSQLSEIDPLEYSRVCKISDDTPDWHKRLDRELTEQQRAEAEKFAEIMSECFRTSGQQCRCNEIPFTEFAEMCSVAAPLAVQCEIQGNEAACEELNSLEMPELPPHLEDVFKRLERDIFEAEFELHMPRECRQAGAESPRECMRIMIQTHAPEECRDALIEANVQNEIEARQICEKIMFDLYAPEECKEAGIQNPRECSALMFKTNAPHECIEAGLTGEHRGDEEKCREIVESQRRDRPSFGVNCREIANPEERLRCYDTASKEVVQHAVEVEVTESPQFNIDELRQRCEAEGGAFVCNEENNCTCVFEKTSGTTETTKETNETTTGETTTGTGAFIRYFFG